MSVSSMIFINEVCFSLYFFEWANRYFLAYFLEIKMDFIKQLASFRLGVKEKKYMNLKKQRNLFKRCGIDS